MLTDEFTVEPMTEADRAWVREFVVMRWGAETVVGQGVIHHPHTLPGLIAVEGGERVGLLTYHIADGQCEVVSIDSTQPNQGVGTALLAAVVEAGRVEGCRRIWLITTNDNLHALRFYQKRGFSLVTVHRGAVDRSRLLKPQIPRIGNDGIPIRDEIELELVLSAQGD